MECHGSRLVKILETILYPHLGTASQVCFKMAPGHGLELQFHVLSQCPPYRVPKEYSGEPIFLCWSKYFVLRGARRGHNKKSSLILTLFRPLDILLKSDRSRVRPNPVFPVQGSSSPQTEPLDSMCRPHLASCPSLRMACLRPLALVWMSECLLRSHMESLYFICYNRPS